MEYYPPIHDVANGFHNERRHALVYAFDVQRHKEKYDNLCVELGRISGSAIPCKKPDIYR